MRKVFLTMCVCASLLLLTNPASAFILNAVDSGWYRSNGYHLESNTNYLTGGTSTRTYRSWFVFDLSGVTDPILSERDAANPLRADLPVNRQPYHSLRTT